MNFMLAVALTATCLMAYTECLAVMSVDLGSEFMKVAIVKPGVPMEIVLNDESRRKTPVVMSMRNDERLFGDPALVVGIKKPQNAYWFTRDLLGKTADNPTVTAFKQNFPYYDIEADEETNMAFFRHDEETVFTPEEIIAMILEKAKATAEKFAEQPIHDAVITVPPYYNQAERRAVLRAASMAGIKVLQIMNENAAVALNFGVFRRKEFTNTSASYMFVDVGSSSAVASIVSYSNVKEKNKVTGIVDSFPQLTIKGVGYDRSLGGLYFQLRLRDHLAKLFNQQKKTSTDVTTNPRSMQKLFKEAGRLMQVLSANSEHFAQVESLLEDIDFRASVKRVEFEELCADLFDRIDDVVEEAMKTSEMTWDELTEVILMGGGTRIPKIQTILKQVSKREELGKSINTDEAAALGAVYQAAHLSKGFKVLKFAVKDANIFPIQVAFERVHDVSQTDGVSSKQIRRVLFGRMNPFPQKKVMTFNKHTTDFNFVVNYGDLDFLGDAEREAFGSRSLQEVALKGVADLFAKHSEDSESKGVKAHFRMDESGILTLDKVEALFEQTKMVEDEPADSGADEESTLSKIGNTISNLFGGSKDAEADQEAKPEDDGAAEEETEKPSEDQEGQDAASPPEGDQVAQNTDSTGQDGEGKGSEEADTGTPKEAEGAKDSKPEEEVDKDAGKEAEEAVGNDAGKEEEAVGNDASKEEEGKGETGKEKADEKGEEKKGDDKKAPKEKKPKVVSIREDIKTEVAAVDITDPSSNQVKASRDKIVSLRKRDDEKKKLEQVKNEIEGFIFQAQDRLYQDVYEKCSTEEQREVIRTAMSEASDWLYEQDETTERKVYEKKLKELKKMTTELEDRVKEMEERPRAIEAFNSVVNYSTHFLKSMANFTGEDKPFTEVEVETLQTLITDALKWNSSIHNEQEKTPDHEKPKLLLIDIAHKINDIDREVKYLINKAKTFRPKPKPKEEKKKSSNATDKTTNTTVDADVGSNDDDSGPQVEFPPIQETGETGDGDKTVEDKEEEETVLELEGGAEQDEKDTDANAAAAAADDDASTKKKSKHSNDDEL